MAFDKITNTGAASRLEQMLLDAEHLLDIQITLHDISGIFHGSEGEPLLGQRRQSHRRFIICHDSPREYCERHCKTDMSQRAAAAGMPFMHECRQGLREVVTPVKTPDDRLHAVLFAGYWRAGRRTGGGRHAAWRQLPAWDRKYAGRLGNVLQILAQGMLAATAHQCNGESKPVTRKAAIMQFLKYNASRPISLSDLAGALALSRSRTSHLVGSLFGASFQSLLMGERMARSKLLLVYTDHSVKEIAQQVGMPNEYYFNRAFRKAIGMPPGKFRQRRRGRVNLKIRTYLTEIY